MIPGPANTTSAGETHWFAIRTATRQEMRAVRSLRALGFPAYMPAEARWCRHARTKTRTESPLLVGYIFAQIPTSALHLARAADGVHSLVSNCGRPLSIAPVWIGAFALAEAWGAFDKTLPTEARRRPKVGDRVNITGSAFMGLSGEIIEARHGDRFAVALKAMTKGGACWPHVFPVAQLEVA